MERKPPDFVLQYEYRPGVKVGTLLRANGARVSYNPLPDLSAFRSRWRGQRDAIAAAMKRHPSNPMGMMAIKIADAMLSFVDGKPEGSIYTLGVVDGNGLPQITLLVDENSRTCLPFTMASFQFPQN